MVALQMAPVILALGIQGERQENPWSLCLTYLAEAVSSGASEEACLQQQDRYQGDTLCQPAASNIGTHRENRAVNSYIRKRRLKV